MKTKVRYTFKVPSNINITQMFKELGYKKVKNQKAYEKKNNIGRFHITFEGLDTYNIHCDVDTLNGRHMTLPSTHELPKEWDRIRPLLPEVKDKYFKIQKKKEIKEKTQKEIKKEKKIAENKRNTLNQKEMKKQLKILKIKNTFFRWVNKFYGKN